MPLAHLNLADAIADMERPIRTYFINNTEPINALARSSNGYVWSLEERPAPEKEDTFTVFGQQGLGAKLRV